MPDRLVINEADSLAQSREPAQMHHEDRAGVNALIRKVDEIAFKKAPITVVMCTNREDQVDPAVRRRCAAIFRFDRPGEELRQQLLRSLLEGLPLDPDAIAELVNLTGPKRATALRLH